MNTNQTYSPEIWKVEKDDIYSALYALKIGAESFEDLLDLLEGSGEVPERMMAIYRRDADLINNTYDKLKNCRINED